jgi:hypothetical protein
MKDLKKLDGQTLVKLGFETLMAIFYLIFAGLFLFPGWFHIQMANQIEGIRIALGIILAIYGIFRIYRVIKKIR